MVKQSKNTLHSVDMLYDWNQISLIILMYVQDLSTLTLVLMYEDHQAA